MNTLSREDLMETPCWSCWWKEGAACFSDKFGAIPMEPNGIFRAGHPLTRKHIEKCKRRKVSPCQGKRATLEKVIPGDMLVIASEVATTLRKTK